VALNYGSQAWVALMGLLFVPLYIRFLGNEAYGLIGFFTAVSVLLHTISMGIVPTLTREMTKIGDGTGKDKNILDLKFTFELSAIIGSVGIFLLFYFLSDFIAKDWLKPDNISSSIVVHAVQLMGLIISIRLVEAVYRSSLIGLGQISSFAIVSSSMATLRGVGAIIVLYFTDGSLLAFFSWNFITTFATLVILKVLVTKILKPLDVTGNFSIASLAKVKRFALGMMVVSVTGSIYSQVDKFILSGLMPLGQYGGYIISANLAAVIFMAVSPLTQAIFPELSKFYFNNKRDDFKQLYIWSIKLVVLLSGSMGFCMVFNASEVLEIWTGNSSINPLLEMVFVLLCISSVFNSLSWIPQQAQFAFGQTSTTVKINLTLFFVLLSLLPYTYANFDALGCAALVLLSNIGYSSFYFFITKRYFVKTDFLDFCKNAVVLPIFASCILALFFRLIFLQVELPSIFELMVSAILSVTFLLLVFGYFKSTKFAKSSTP